MGIFDFLNENASGLGLLGGIGALGYGIYNNATDDTSSRLMEQAAQQDAVANSLRQQAATAWSGLSTPTYSSNGYGYSGDINPILLNYSSNAPTYNGANISQDPNYKQYMMQALSNMRNYADTGLSQADLLESTDLRNQLGRSAAAGRSAIDQQMASRGLGSSGMNLGLQMGQNQNATDQLASQQNALLKQAIQNRMAASQNMGNMASSYNNADVANQLAISNPINDFNKWVYEQKASEQQNNNLLLNNAQQQNLTNKQSVMNQNVNRDDSLRTQDFTNRLNKLQGYGGALSGQAGGYNAASTALASQAAANDANNRGYITTGLNMIGNSSKKGLWG